ncbi:hypothetical protein [Streptomyces hawaiiensis]|uniref:Uncharacterized protein n=1 Tax=Streptomyces hawaiiensis TaxID=67305 RepID=A0A6G5RNC3_9ACTN|nr:hypothetical protein CEB94_32675 [Streptomyces hawaiiensis]
MWPKAAELVHGADLERLESHVLTALRALDTAQHVSAAGGTEETSTPETYEAIDSAAREVARAFEAHAPLGAVLAAEFDALAARRERFGPAAPPPHWVPSASQVVLVVDPEDGG